MTDMVVYCGAGFAGQLAVPRMVTSGEVHRHVTAADLFTLPSSDEGVPRSLVEAMAWGGATAGTLFRHTAWMIRQYSRW
jgi:hypothetical protein